MQNLNINVKMFWAPSRACNAKSRNQQDLSVRPLIHLNTLTVYSNLDLGRLYSHIKSVKKNPCHKFPTQISYTLDTSTHDTRHKQVRLEDISAEENYFLLSNLQLLNMSLMEPNSHQRPASSLTLFPCFWQEKGS